MAFISNRDARSTLQGLTPYVDAPQADFSQVFGASLGLVIDEELSISQSLNREGWEDRRQTVSKMIADGEVNRAQHVDRRGRFDYDRLARTLEDPRIKTNDQLEEERRNLLAMRRDYAEDVIERGEGLAQFLGAATGYMLDPITIATMPIATASTAAKSASVLGRALMTARNETALAAAAEVFIQPLVYEHKQDIESPWTETDAIQNMAMAALGAGLIGGVAGGISGYVKNLRGKTEIAARNAGDMSSDISTKTVNDADANLMRIEQALGNSPEVDLKAVEADFVNNLKAELAAETSQRIPRGERKQLAKEIQALQARRNQIESEPVIPEPQKGVSRRVQKQRAIREAAQEADLQRQELDLQIDALKRRLSVSKAGQEAEADLTRLEQGIIPDKYKPRLEEAKNQALVDSESQFLIDLERQRTINNQPSKTVATYETVEPGDPELPPVPQEATTQRQAELLNITGLKDEYDAAMVEFERLDSPKIVDDSGENLIDAKGFMKEVDDELEGLESVLVCSRG